MGHVVTHLPDLGHQGLDAVQHGIEGHRQLIDLVAPALDGDPLFQRSSGDGLRRPSNRLDAREGPPGHEPADPRRQADEQDHRGEKDAPESADDAGVVFHGLADLKNDAGADHGVQDAHLISPRPQDDRFQDGAVSGQQPFDGRFTDTDFLPVGHVGGGKGLTGRVEETEEDLSHTGLLGLEKGEVGGRRDSPVAQDRGKLSRFRQQILIRFFLDDGGDERVEQKEGGKGGCREDACVPQGQAEGKAIPEATGFL